MYNYVYQCTNNYLRQKLLPHLSLETSTHTLSNPRHEIKKLKYSSQKKKKNLCKRVHYSAKYLNLIGSPLSALFLFGFFSWLLLWLCTGRSGRFRCLGLAGSWERKEGERIKLLAAHLVILHVLYSGWDYKPDRQGRGVFTS